MGSVLPYQNILEKDGGKDYTVVRFDNYKSNVLITERYCTNPGCTCTEVCLTFIEIDEQANPIEQLFSISLDIDTWEIKEKNIDSKDINAEEIIKEFMDSLDEDLKVKFRSHLCQAKEYGGKHYLDHIPKELVKEIIKGTTIGYSEIYGPKDSEKFIFLYNELDEYLIDDQYCMQPKCLCNGVILSFISINTNKELQKPKFVIRLNINNYKYEVEEINCQRDEMESVIKYVFQNKPEMLKLLKKRYGEMKTAGREAVNKYKQDGQLQMEPVLKVSRNDPCPCGSGKKYKKCCGK